MYGSVPAYRTLKEGVSDGPDATELNKNLIDLGYDPYSAITDDEDFSEATAAAVRRCRRPRGFGRRAKCSSAASSSPPVPGASRQSRSRSGQAAGRAAQKEPAFEDQGSKEPPSEKPAAKEPGSKKSSPKKPASKEPAGGAASKPPTPRKPGRSRPPQNRAPTKAPTNRARARAWWCSARPPPSSS